MLENSDFKDSPNGKWSNTQCSRHNFNVLCQKIQEITFAKLTEMLFKLKKDYEKEKKELKDSMAEMQTVESDLRHQAKELKQSESLLLERIEALEKNETKYLTEIDNLKKSENALKMSVLNFQSNTTASIEKLEKEKKELKQQIDKTNEAVAAIQALDQTFKNEIQRIQNELINKAIEGKRYKKQFRITII